MYIGDDIKITVLDIRGGQVRIGITAPQDSQKFIEKKFTNALLKKSRFGKEVVSLRVIISFMGL